MITITVEGVSDGRTDVLVVIHHNRPGNGCPLSTHCYSQSRANKAPPLIDRRDSYLVSGVLILLGSATSRGRLLF